MIDLTERALAPEQMDAPDLPGDVYADVLRDLSRVNIWTMASHPTLNFLDRVAGSGNRLRILDVGFGAGDMLRRIRRWSERRGIRADLVGIDLNPRSVAIARAATSADDRIDFRTGDYADLRGGGWDIILSSLVAHHMTHAQLVDFLRFMEDEAGRGWLINDLMRHRVAHTAYPILARLMRWHPIVRQDGTLSIARSYRPNEWPLILADAGVEDARIFRAFPFRLCVERCR